MTKERVFSFEVAHEDILFSFVDEDSMDGKRFQLDVFDAADGGREGQTAPMERFIGLRCQCMVFIDCIPLRHEGDIVIRIEECA